MGYCKTMRFLVIGCQILQKFEKSWEIGLGSFKVTYYQMLAQVKETLTRLADKDNQDILS